MEHVEPESNEKVKIAKEANAVMQAKFIQVNELCIKLFKKPVIFTGTITMDETGFPYIGAFCNGNPLVNSKNFAQGLQFWNEFCQFLTGLQTISNILEANAAVNN